jgi:hypothetical protein
MFQNDIVQKNRHPARLLLEKLHFFSEKCPSLGNIAVSIRLGSFYSSCVVKKFYPFKAVPYLSEKQQQLHSANRDCIPTLKQCIPMSREM